MHWAPRTRHTDEPHKRRPAHEPRPFQPNDELRVAFAFDLVTARVEPRHRAAIVRERTLVVQVRQPMVGERLGRHRCAGRGLDRQRPGPQHVAALEHQVPMRGPLVTGRAIVP